MEKSVPVGLSIALAPERLDEGSDEERTTFGLFSIATAEASLTEGFDYFLKGYRKGPLVSGYHAAEWFAWNWWRLRWEPRSSSENWEFAHCMTSIGEGYLWPNLRIFSDGVRTALISSPSTRSDAKPFRYVGSTPLILSSTLFEGAVDEFVQQMISQLRANELESTNLERVWTDVLAERDDPILSKFRKIEALLGYDADEIAEEKIAGLISEYDRLGPTALEEVAADSAQSGHSGPHVPTVEKLESVAKEKGYDTSPRDMVRLRREHQLARGAHIPGWRIGAAAAQSIREQEKLGAAPLSNHRLAQLSGSEERALSDVGVSGFDIGFILDKVQTTSRLVLRSKPETGRRFELARLLGDRLINPNGLLHPATRAYTYRQKAQRAFAAELLSPFDAVDEMLRGDLSSENQEEVATYFDVSPMTIHTLLMNHGRIPREEPDADFEAAAV
jgi:Zn-dependent peptidase ImmA (M78 family)